MKPQDQLVAVIRISVFNTYRLAIVEPVPHDITSFENRYDTLLLNNCDLLGFDDDVQFYSLLHYASEEYTDTDEIAMREPLENYSKNSGLHMCSDVLKVIPFNSPAGAVIQEFLDNWEWIRSGEPSEITTGIPNSV